MSDKEQEITEENVDENADENTEEQEAESSDEEETSNSLEDLNYEIADSYLNLLDIKKGGNIATAASLGISLNPLRQSAIDYILANPKEEENFFDKIGDKFKKEILKKIPGGEMLEYNKADLKKMKELIKQNKDNKTALESIMSQIAQGIDPTISSSETSDNNSSDDSNNPKPVENTSVSKPDEEQNTSLSSSNLFEGLVAGGTLVVLNDEDIKFVRETVASINPEIEGDFVKIEKIKDKEGNVILECNGKTPYINKNIINDLLGLSVAFYKKTGDPLTLNSSYRTIAQQKELDDANDDNAAEPGYSSHNLGLSIDVESSDRKIKTLGGLKGFRELAEKFNFRPLDGEDWHFDHNTLPKPDDRLATAQRLDQEFADNIAA